MSWTSFVLFATFFWFVESIPVNLTGKGAASSLEVLPTPIAKRSVRSYYDEWIAQHYPYQQYNEESKLIPRIYDRPVEIPSEYNYGTRSLVRNDYQPHLYAWHFTPTPKPKVVGRHEQPLNNWVSEIGAHGDYPSYSNYRPVIDASVFQPQFVVPTSQISYQSQTEYVWPYGRVHDPATYSHVYEDDLHEKTSGMEMELKHENSDAAHEFSEPRNESKDFYQNQRNSEQNYKTKDYLAYEKGVTDVTVRATEKAFAPYELKEHIDRAGSFDFHTTKAPMKTHSIEPEKLYTDKSSMNRTESPMSTVDSIKGSNSKTKCEKGGKCKAQIKPKPRENVVVTEAQPVNFTFPENIDTLDHKRENSETWDDCSDCDFGCGGCEGEKDFDKKLLENNFLNSIDSEFRSLIFNPMADSHEKFQSCVTPINETGNCRYIQHCLLSNIIGGVQQFMSYVCLINDRFIGVCCPEFPVSQVDVQWDQNVTIEGNNSVGTAFMPEECGLSSKTRIVGGSNADPAEYPWMAALLTMDKGQFFCGGAVINEQYILTAAHCTFSVPRNQILVRLGEYDFGNEDAESPGEDYPVVEIKRHGLYSRRTLLHDIALLKLGRRIKFNKRVGTICFPQKDEKFVGKTATLAGWGNTKGGGPSSEVLLEAALPVVENDVCSENHGLPIPTSFICTQSEDKEKGACNGDSGGPLMLMDEETKIWKVIGLVSWGRRGCEPNFPTVYTRITDYLDWIDNFSL